MSIFFASDNTTGPAPCVADALQDAFAGHAPSYGADAWAAELKANLTQLFACELEIFVVATGTAANALAMGCVMDGFGACFVHPSSHVFSRESNAPEFYTGGGKFVETDGQNGLICPEILAKVAEPRAPGGVHAIQGQCVSLSQLSDTGTVYTLEHLRAIGDVARRHRMAVHMDGARFANAMAHLDVSPADATWRAGIDILSLGGTKNGCLMGEAVVIFKTGRHRHQDRWIERAPFLRKRGGQLLSKERFANAQLNALFGDDSWLRLARHANEKAREVARVLGDAGFEAVSEVVGNMVYVLMAEPEVQSLRSQGVVCHAWTSPIGHVARFVTSWATTSGEVSALADALAARVGDADG